MANRNARKIFISLVIGVITACISLSTYSKLQQQIKEKDQLIKVMQLGQKQNANAKFTYLTATHDMLAGDTITQDDIQTSTFSEEEPDGLSSADLVIGNVLLEPVKSGQILTGYAFTGVTVPSKKNPLGMRDGYRALTLSTGSLDGLSAQMKAGTVVDVFSKSKNNQFVLSKVKILSLEPTEGTDTKDLTITKAKTATFEVPADKIQDLVEIYSSGKILLVMRPVGDDTVITGKKQPQNSSGSYGSGFHNANYSYSPSVMTSLPEVPDIQTYEDKTINEMPAPVIPKKNTRTVEIIEAANKTQITFD